LEAAPASGADLLIQELEDFTAPAMRPRAREIAPELLLRWRAAGCAAGVRINPLQEEGSEDLAAVMRGHPHCVALPKVSDPAQIEELDSAIGRFERDYGIAPGSTEILPNLESARAVVELASIVAASPRIAALLLASEDLAADLGAERGRDGFELAYARQRFLLECVAARTLAVDAPYTWTDEEGLVRDTRWARRLGFKAKSCVAPSHAAVINRVLTPSDEEVIRARRIVDAFESARAEGKGRVELDGSLVEMPIYATAKRLLDRSRELGQL
jgi:citrate lyase subunit beta/citryl-CoA lyase